MDSPIIMKKILVLGHRGMLGHIVKSYLEKIGFYVYIIEYKWPELEFIETIKNSDADFVINCIGKIPQKNADNYDENSLIPLLLKEKFKGHIIHPASNCEIEINSKCPYIKSKIQGSSYLRSCNKAFIIQCSIIGPELYSSNSLWSWFENNKEDEIKGFSNCFWNGITTLEWAKFCVMIIDGSVIDNHSVLQTDKISKYKLLKYLNSELKLNKTIEESKSAISEDLCLRGFPTKNIKSQIAELIDHRNRI